MMAARSKSSKGVSVVTIRKMATSDVPAVLAILKESPEAAAWSQESLLQLTSADPAAWVAELSGVPVGFLSGRIAADEFDILNMAVSLASRRNGIGSKLLEYAIEFSRIAGCSRAYLEVRAANGSAIALYARHGFTECGCRAHYYQEPVEDALLLSLRLDGRNQFLKISNSHAKPGPAR
jgi:ribosomal-protein-alanine N-acetyltransferase